MINAGEAYALMKKNQSSVLIEVAKETLRKFFSFRIKNAAEEGESSVSITWDTVPSYDYVTILDVLYELKRNGFYIDEARGAINICWVPVPKVW